MPSPGTGTLYSTHRRCISSHTCEYFYLAAKLFSPNTLEIKDIGLFDLTRMEIIKNPAYLYPDPDFRANIMRRIKNNFKVLTDAVDDPFQKSLLNYEQVKQ